MIAALYGRLREKEDQLRRLRACLVELDSCQSEFNSHQKKITEPSLSSTSWQGNLAEKFSEIRIDDMEDRYQNIGKVQIEEVKTLIQAKIIEIEAEIEAIKAQIALLEEQERQAALEKEVK